MATAPRSRTYTFDEYLDLEKNAEYKSEFHSGEIYAMSGGSFAHSVLSARFVFLLTQCVGKECSVCDSNMNVRIEQFDKGIYPDALVICGAPQFWGKRKDVVLNPTLVVEVLSPSTEDFNRDTKVSYYCAVPSIQHILLAEQDRILITHYERKSDKSWTVTSYSSRTDRIALMGFELSVDAVYSNLV